MDEGISDFLRDYIEALERGSAALFVGAGLSMAAEMPSWGKLLEGMARDIGLDVNREHDLVAVAQWYVNHHAGSRAHLARLIRRTFEREVTVPENQRLLARLPFSHVWTTNYDEIIEQAFEQAGKIVDVKSRNADLVTSDLEADCVLYKMHGTSGHPDEVVLTKDDYELYARTRPGFLQILGSDLTTRTFLFLGLSFSDPNLGYLMATLRSSFKDVQRQHFTIMKRPGEAYEARHFDHFTKDLHRYGIRTFVVDDYAKTTEVLARLSRRYAQRNVLLSGSYPEDGDEKARAFVGAIARGAGRIIGARGLRLVTGLGRTVGSAGVTGMIEALDGLSGAAISRRLIVRPVREVTPLSATIEEAKRKSREDLVEQCGVVVVCGGLRRGELSPGVMQEFEMAAEKGKIVLPLAGTGHAAKKIWETMRARPEVYLTKEIDAGMFEEIGPNVTAEGAILTWLERCLSRMMA